MRRTLIVGAVVAVLACVVAGAYFVPAVQDSLFTRAAMAGAGARTDLVGDDALRVLVCGSRGPLPHPSAAETCIAVLAGGRVFVVDTGSGGAANLQRARLPLERLEAVFLTHLHSDHFGDLGELNTNSWIAGRRAPLPVYGPRGVERITRGFNQAYTADRGYRTAHHGPAIANPATAPLAPVALSLRKGGATIAAVYDRGGVRVMAFVVEHDPASPAYGYRFDYGGRSVVISGDTKATKAMVKMAAGADVLLHEALAAHMLPALADAARAAQRAGVPKIMADIPGYHATPVQAATIAQQAKVRQLVLYHLVPAPRNDLMERIFLRGVSDVRPDTLLAHDGMLLTLPVRSEVVDIERM